MLITERLTFDTLLRWTDAARVARSLTVRGLSPSILDTSENQETWAFNCKSYPSTTGLRHRSTITFLKPKNGQNKPLEQLDCIADCTCADLRYRFAHVLKQHGAGRVGSQSLNQALNRAPRLTNPTGKVSLCKHLAGLASYIYGNVSKMWGTGKPSSEAMSRLVRYAAGRVINEPSLIQQARARDVAAKAARQAKNQGVEPVVPTIPYVGTPAPVEPTEQLEITDLEEPEPGPAPPPATPRSTRRRQRESLEVLLVKALLAEDDEPII